MCAKPSSYSTSVSHTAYTSRGEMFNFFIFLYPQILRPVYRLFFLVVLSPSEPPVSWLTFHPYICLLPPNPLPSLPAFSLYPAFLGPLLALILCSPSLPLTPCPLSAFHKYPLSLFPFDFLAPHGLFCLTVFLWPLSILVFYLRCPLVAVVSLLRDRSC